MHSHFFIVFLQFPFYELIQIFIVFLRDFNFTQSPTKIDLNLFRRINFASLWAPEVYFLPPSEFSWRMSIDPNINYGITFVACFDEESNQKIREAMKRISNYRICKMPMKNGNREDLDSLPYHSTLSSWKIGNEPEIVEQIRKFFLL